jgi:subtilase family serine protease
MIRRSLASTLATAVVLGSMLAAGAGGVAGAATPQAVRGTKPAWANASHLVRRADPRQVIGFRLYLGWKDANAAEALARAVSDPASSSYGKFLTPAQFRKRFAPSDNDIAAVQKWLRSAGFKLTHTPSNHHFVAVSGTARQIEAAFGVKLNVYKVGGKKVRAPSSSLKVPSTIAKLISGAIGIDESSDFVQPTIKVDAKAPPVAGFRNAPPLSAYWAELVSPYAYPAGFTAVADPATASWTVAGYVPAQIKGAYGISGYDGAGQTVAVIDAFASPTILADVNQWSTNRGLPTMTPGQLTQVVPPGIFNKPQNKQMDPQGWYSEETLDIEAVHGMAPAAKIVYVGAPNNRRDLDAALNYVVDRRIARIVTNSYGYATELLPPGYVIPVEQTLIQAAATGIGVYFASGDNGDESSRFGFATTDYPASSPWVTSVGGTSLGISEANTRALETGWGTSNYTCNATTLACTGAGWLYASGGGVSQIFAKPAYQSGLSATGRAVPDIAALGDVQTGLIVGQTQTFPDGAAYGESRSGGTSVSVQIMGGLMALADQAAGTPHGFANPLFYANPGAFYDVLSVKTAVARRNFNNNVDASAGTSDFLRTFDDYSGSPSQHTGPGWDNVTGLGTPGEHFLATFGQ